MPPNNPLITKLVKVRENLNRSSMRNAFDSIRRISLSKENRSGKMKEEGKLRLIKWIINLDQLNRSN